MSLPLDMTIVRCNHCGTLMQQSDGGYCIKVDLPELIDGCADCGREDALMDLDEDYHYTVETFYREPTLDDFVMSPTGSLGSQTSLVRGFQSWKFSTDAEAFAKVKEEMRKDRSINSDVWYINDHGNVFLVDRHGNFHDPEVDHLVVHERKEHHV